MCVCTRARVYKNYTRYKSSVYTKIHRLMRRRVLYIYIRSLERPQRSSVIRFAEPTEEDARVDARCGDDKFIDRGVEEELFCVGCRVWICPS